MILVMVPRASVSAERVREVLDTEPVILDPEPEEESGGSPECPADTGVSSEPTSRRGQRGVLPLSSRDAALVFDDVSFHYGGSEHAAISDISFTARRGETLAIIGSTGSGKSTILNLALRLYDVSSGRILLNGVDLRDQPQKEVHDRIGYIPQKAVLFSGTIADNVRFGKPDASDDEVIDALKVAQAWEFVRELTDGIEAPVSQGGKNFSGGQKQRLAIARALIKHPEVYLFDDSFSALDLQTDAALRSALRPLLTESIQVIVAQRISTIQDADTIVVLEEGKMCGLGTHAELLANNQVYREIASSQLTEEEMAHV